MSEVLYYKVVAVCADGTEKEVPDFRLKPYEGTVAPPEPPSDDAPIAAVVTNPNGLNVRSDHFVANNPSNIVGEFQNGEQIWVSVETYAKDGDNWIWRKVIKVNGTGDSRVGKYVAEKNRDSTIRHLDIQEENPLPPSKPPDEEPTEPDDEPVTRRRGAKRALIGTQTIPVITKDGKIDEPFGFNMRPLAYGGIGIAPFQHSTNHYINFTLERLQIAGFKKCRLYAPMKGQSDDFMLDQIETALNRLGNFGMEAMIVLMDCVDGGQNSPHRYTEDQPFYKGGYIAAEYFTEKHYRTRMKPFVEKLVKRLKGRVWAYAVANEPRIYNKTPTMQEQNDLVDFLHEIADLIHAKDPDALVTPGLLNIAHLHNGVGEIKDAWNAVYGSGKFDFAGFHVYEERGQNPGELWKHEQLVLDHDLKYSREMEEPLPIIPTEYWRNNNNPHGTEAVKQKTKQWAAYGMEGFPWAAFFGPDENFGDNENGWCKHADDQWEGTLAYLADEYIPERREAYGLA